MAAGFGGPPTDGSGPLNVPVPADWRAWLEGAPELLASLTGGPAGGTGALPPLAIGLATVDLDRAERALGALRFAAVADDEALGARARRAILSDGTALLLLEPLREGPLSAFLARHGEAVAAIYVPARSATGERTEDAAITEGPLGLARLRQPAARWGPFVLEVSRPGRSPRAG